MKITEHFWAVIDKKGKVVNSISVFGFLKSERLEIHRTRKLAEANRLRESPERVVKVQVIHEL